MKVKIYYDFRDDFGNEYPSASTTFDDAKSYNGITVDNFIHVKDKDGDHHYISAKHVRLISVMDNV